MNYTLENIPTVAQYLDAFRQLEHQGQMTAYLKKLLSSQYYAPNREVRGGVWATEFGYKDTGPINLHYGGLGRLVADTLGIDPPLREKDGSERLWIILAEGWYDAENKFVWRMYSQVAEALEQLGWVEPNRT